MRQPCSAFWGETWAVTSMRHPRIESGGAWGRGGGVGHTGGCCCPPVWPLWVHRDGDTPLPQPGEASLGSWCSAEPGCTSARGHSVGGKEGLLFRRSFQHINHLGVGEAVRRAWVSSRLRSEQPVKFPTLRSRTMSPFFPLLPPLPAIPVCFPFLGSGAAKIP